MHSNFFPPFLLVTAHPLCLTRARALSAGALPVSKQFVRVQGPVPVQLRGAGRAGAGQQGGGRAGVAPHRGRMGRLHRLPRAPRAPRPPASRKNGRLSQVVIMYD